MLWKEGGARVRTSRRAEVPRDRRVVVRVVADAPVRLVGAVDDAHAVGDEVGHVRDALRGDGHVAVDRVGQLVVGGACIEEGHPLEDYNQE